jgi:hypothetical protein
LKYFKKYYSKYFKNILNNIPDIVPCLRTGSNDFAIFQGFFSSVSEHEKHKIHEKKIGGQSARWAVAPVESYSTPKRKATQFAIVNRVHSRLMPTRPFSKRSPTYVVDSKTEGNSICRRSSDSLSAKMGG